MKLIQIVAECFNKWPDFNKCKLLKQDSFGVFYYIDRNSDTHMVNPDNFNSNGLADDYEEASVSFDQWVRFRRLNPKRVTTY